MIIVAPIPFSYLTWRAVKTLVSRKVPLSHFLVALHTAFGQQQRDIIIKS